MGNWDTYFIFGASLECASLPHLSIFAGDKRPIRQLRETGYDGLYTKSSGKSEHEMKSIVSPRIEIQGYEKPTVEATED